MNVVQMPEPQPKSPLARLWLLIRNPRRFYQLLCKQPKVYHPLLFLLVPALGFGAAAYRENWSRPDVAQVAASTLAGSYVIMLAVALLYTLVAIGAAKLFAGKAHWKAAFAVSCSAWVPYALGGISNYLLIPAFIWSLVLMMFGMAAALELPFRKSAFVQTCLYVTGVCAVAGLMLHGYNTSMERLLAHYPLLDKPAPNINLTPLQGAPIPIASLRGQVIVIDFWATWCPPCRQALPVVSTAVKSFAEKGVSYYAIDVGENQHHVQAYLNEHNLAINAAVDTNEQAAKAFQIQGLPQLVVIDKQGIVRWAHAGYSPFLPDQLRAELNRVLGKP